MYGDNAMDRLQTMQSFARVARTGSFTVAAGQLGLSRGLVSRHVAALESRLGVRLLLRSTRHVRLTEEGGLYLEQCERLLGDLEATERSLVSSGKSVSGMVRVVAPKSFGSLFVAEAMAGFAHAQPHIRASLILNDFTFRPYDFVEHGFDVGIRIGAIRDSALISRQIATLEWVLCAAPAYLARDGRPRTLAELAHRPCLAHINVDPTDRIWRFKGPNGAEAVKIDGPLLSNSALALRQAALAGLGIALLPFYCIGRDLADGRLVRLLPQFRMPRRPVVAVHTRGVYMPKKTRLLVDFLAAWFRDPAHKPG
jgi:DNA-binding transcriptional LysR family regulator